jgi:hypothetical protein
VRHARTQFAARLHRSAALALLLYEAMFLNVLVPGHTRGAITLSGGAVASCCASHQSRSSQHVPTQKDRENCAVCNFAARMSTPPVISWTMPKLGLVQLLPFPPPSVATSIDRRLPYLSRGPPSLA